MLIDLRVGPNDLAVIAVQPLGNSDASNTLSFCFLNNRYTSQNYVYEFEIRERFLRKRIKTKKSEDFFKILK